MTVKIVDGKAVYEPDDTAGLAQISYTPKPTYNDTMKTRVWEKLNVLGNDVNIGGLSKEQIATAGLNAEDLDFINNNLVTKDTPWYQDSGMLGSIAGLGSAFAQLAALPSQIDYAKTQSKALKQNMATAKEEQDRRNKNISAFNSFNAG